jgi:hypothetical protein
MLGCLGMAADSSAQISLAPVITLQPQPQTSFEGANINLRVSATPSTGVRYYWRFNGLDLPRSFPGQSTPLLSLQNVSKAAAGPYSVVVSNSFGAVTSQTAVVTVNDLDSLGLSVGYINMSATPGYSLFSLQLAQVLSDQTVDRQLGGVQDGSSLFKLDGSGFVANNYMDGWSAPDQILTVGEGFFFYNPTAQPFGLTVVGGVLSGRLVNRLPAGLSLCGSLIPQAGELPVLGFEPTPGARVYHFDRQTGSYSLYTTQEGDWIPSAPSLAVAEALFVQEPTDIDWVRTFTLMLEDPSSIYKIVQPQLTSEVGEVNFFTFNYNNSLGQVLDLDGVTPLNSQFMGQLYAGTNAVENTLEPMGQPLAFQAGAGAGYIRGATVKIPGLPGGQTVALQLRVWEKCAGDTHKQAVLNGSASGRSEIFQTVLHATVEAGAPGLPPRNANTFPSFLVSLGQSATLRVARVQTTTNGVEVCFATQPGWVYGLEKCASWEGHVNWVEVPGAEEVIGTGHTAKVLDSTTEQCFYRLRRVR